MYSLAGYGSMIADRVRMDVFARALHHAITPDSVVVDIGTGTGILALLACRFGARRVYAIEPDDAIQVAREIAAANGYADRIDFIQAVSTKVTFPGASERRRIGHRRNAAVRRPTHPVDCRRTPTFARTGRRAYTAA